jgi:hypothetical protein
MDAKTLINLVKFEKLDSWQNSDLYDGVQTLLEQIAVHYESCQECREAFDDMSYDEETLKDMEILFLQNMDINKWICEEE